MDKEKELTSTKESDFTGFNEIRLDKQANLSKNQNIQGTILFSQPKSPRKKRPFKWNRIRSFFIINKKLQRKIECSVHPGGVHLLHQAMFYSDNGCPMCRVYVEKNLF